MYSRIYSRSLDGASLGETRSGDEHNMSLDRLARDLKNVLAALYGAQLPEIILVGHRYSYISFWSSSSSCLLQRETLERVL